MISSTIAVLFSVSRPWMIVLDVIVWGVWSFTAGFIAHRIPAARFERDTWLTRLRPAETRGTLYRRLGVKRWKDRLPEAGSFFAGGFSKRAVVTRDPAYLERFVVETRRAEVTHWLVMLAVPVFALWNPWWVLPIMLAYALVANVPCLLVQRYNRARLLRVLSAVRRVRPDPPRATT